MRGPDFTCRENADQNESSKGLQDNPKPLSKYSDVTEPPQARVPAADGPGDEVADFTELTSGITVMAVVSIKHGVEDLTSDVGEMTPFTLAN